MRFTFGLIAMVFLSWASTGAAQSPGSRYIDQNLPHWVDVSLRPAGLGQQFQLFHDLNPYYLRGDFDGDGKVDIAVQIIDTSNRKRGIAIVHQADSSVHIVGAGHRLGGGDDFSWLWVWRVDTPSTRDPGRVRETLFVEKPESASGWIVWNGHEYTWIQGSD